MLGHWLVRLETPEKPGTWFASPFSELLQDPVVRHCLPDHLALVLLKGKGITLFIESHFL